MSEVTHRTIETNGIRMHIAEQGEGPLVLLCHGFPESWYSWRNQLRALADAGFRAVAPDMRGYGQTDAPAEIEKYTLLHVVGDMVGVLDALGAERGDHRARLGRAGRLARGTNAAGPFSRCDRLERAVPATRRLAAHCEDAAK
jgi:pimeloyl-ACP methyl ester carboxylesterase